MYARARVAQYDEGMKASRTWILATLVACGGGGSASDGGVDGAPSDGAANDVATSDAGGDAIAPSGPTIAGCPMFPPDYPYNVDISNAPLDNGSATYITNLTARAGAIVAEYPGDEWVNVVPATQPNVTVQFTSTGGEAFGFDTSDTFFHTATPPQIPIPNGVVYENMTNPNSDHHVIIVQQTTCKLFEMYSWNPSSATDGWEGVVTWNLDKNEQLPDGWGSTTAAGTPLLPGVILV